MVKLGANQLLMLILKEFGGILRILQKLLIGPITLHTMRCKKLWA
jgi:hypothetical protein